MAKKKLQRFDENRTFPFFFESDYFALQKEQFSLKGKWKKEFFKNDHPLVLELGCGKGEYTVGLAQRFPGKNFIGIDIKGARMWRGAKTVSDNKMTNVAFLRTRIGLITEFFEKAEVDEIWITFPDPQPGCRANKRLTSPRFLQKYKHILSAEHIIHLKTDSDLLFEYTTEVVDTNGLKLIARSADINADFSEGALVEIMTFYESIWRAQGIPIKYISFSIPEDRILYERD